VGRRHCPVDYHDAVVRTDLPSAEADGGILTSREKMRDLGAPGSWHVGPAMQPSDLGERLVDHGFGYGGDDIGMAVDLAALGPDPRYREASRSRGSQTMGS
jgi:hypothetical protein